MQRIDNHRRRAVRLRVKNTRRGSESVQRYAGVKDHAGHAGAPGLVRRRARMNAGSENPTPRTMATAIAITEPSKSGLTVIRKTIPRAIAVLTWIETRNSGSASRCCDAGD